jgi:integrase
MAWAERLSSGKWRGGWRDTTNKKHYTRRPEFPEHPYSRKSDARAAAQEAEVRAQRQAAVEQGTLSAGTDWAAWWDQIASDRVRPDTNTDTAEKYIVSKYLKPQWAGAALNEIRHKPVQRWVNDLRDGKAPGWKHARKPEPSYVCRIYAVFRASIQAAVDAEVLDASPCAGVKLPKVPKKRKQHLTVAESATIGAKLRADYRDAVELALETGLRPSELCGLHVHRVDRTRRVIEVCQVYVSRKHVMRDYPKDKDARMVPLTSKAEEIIARRVAGRDVGGGCGIPHSDGSTCDSVLVLMTNRGKPMRGEEITKRMVYAAKAKNVPRRTPYSARRGFATRLADGGVDPVRGAEVMGHATVEQFAEYVQETPAAQAQILAALGERTRLALAGADGADAWGKPGANSVSEVVEDSGPDRDQDAV